MCTLQYRVLLIIEHIRRMKHWLNITNEDIKICDVKISICMIHFCTWDLLLKFLIFYKCLRIRPFAWQQVWKTERPYLYSIHNWTKDTMLGFYDNWIIPLWWCEQYEIGIMHDFVVCMNYTTLRHKSCKMIISLINHWHCSEHSKS